MKSWKTTLAGVAAILGALSASITQFLAGDIGTAVTTLTVGIPAGIGLILARDNDKSSEDVNAK